MTVAVRRRPWHKLLITVTSGGISFGAGNYLHHHRLLIPLISGGVSLIAGVALVVLHRRYHRNISGQ